MNVMTAPIIQKPLLTRVNSYFSFNLTATLFDSEGRSFVVERVGNYGEHYIRVYAVLPEDFKGDFDREMGSRKYELLGACANADHMFGTLKAYNAPLDFAVAGTYEVMQKFLSRPH